MRRALALAASVSIFAVGCAHVEAPEVEAAPPAAVETSPAPLLPEAKVRMKHLQVPMRDGARLDTDVYLPEADGKFPAVLIRTPYDREISNKYGLLNQLIESGYAIVQQHERGRYFSEGEMRMLGNADEDGWNTLDWIVAQDWSNGKIATYGCSSSAENQMKLSTLGHPALKATIAFSAGVGIAEAGPFHEQGNFWRGGVWQMGWANYFWGAMPIHWPQFPAGLSDKERQRLSSAFSIEADEGLDQEKVQELRLHLPVVELGDLLGMPSTELEEYLERGPAGAVWAEDRITTGDEVTAPGLFAEALYDISSRSGVARFVETAAQLPEGSAAIFITNGQHCGYGRETEDTIIGERALGDARYDYDGAKLAWLDRWLKDGADTATLAKPVNVFMAGANQWAAFDAVPVAGEDETLTLYLSSGGAANTLGGDGTVSAAIPARDAFDAFDYDPANPVISHGGEISGMGADQEDGAFDQREIEARPDVLVYTSEPLEADTPVFGFINAPLFVSSDAPDTDFTVKLVDVAPDGTAWNIADTILRMRYREGYDKEVFIEESATYEIAPPPMLAANVFLKGHRIRVEVSSSNFPTYARNLNTAANPYTTTETRVAHNTVLHGPATLSRIELPIVALED